MLWDFFTQVLRLPMMAFKRVLSNPMGIFVYGILSKWYVMVVIGAMIVTFWVFKGLEKAGVLDAINAQLKKGFDESQAVAQHCTPLIMNLADMWNCIQNPPAYLDTADSIALKAGLTKDAGDNVKHGANMGADANPYDDEAEHHPQQQALQPKETTGDTDAASIRAAPQETDTSTSNNLNPSVNRI